MEKSTLKKEIRNKIRQQRNALTEIEVKEKSLNITERLVETKAYKEAKLILVYISCKNEVDTELLIKKALDAGKLVAAPRVTGDDMEFILFNSLREFKTGAFGILEPTGKEKAEAYFGKLSKNEVLMLMPGVAFDGNRNRIGQGGGYYDRYLEANSVTTVALAYDFQIVEHIETEEFDIKPEIIVTELHII